MCPKLVHQCGGWCTESCKFYESNGTLKPQCTEELKRLKNAANVKRKAEKRAEKKVQKKEESM
jgi:hypothetical protein